MNVLFFENEGGFGEEIIVDPGGDGPMFFWDLFCQEDEMSVGGRKVVKMTGSFTVVTFGFGLGLSSSLEFIVERFVVEESPRIVEFTVPRPFQIFHRLYHAIHLRVPYQCQQSCIYPWCIWIVSCVVIFSPEVAFRLIGDCNGVS